MWRTLHSAFVWRFSFLLTLLIFINSPSEAQDLLSFIEDCKNCIGKVKLVKTRQKVDYSDYQSPIIDKTDLYNAKGQLIKTEIFVDKYLSKTINYGYQDSLLIYEQHLSPEEEDFFLVYQYYQKRFPGKILKVDNNRKIINYAQLEYSQDYKPIYLKFYNLLGELLEKSSVEYYSNNQVVIRYFDAKNQESKLHKYELFCKYNQPDKLRKRDFKDLVTRPINLKKEQNFVTVVKAVQTEYKERVHIDEIIYDDSGNWLSKKTFELKKNKNKRKLIKEIEREIEYY